MNRNSSNSFIKKNSNSSFSKQPINNQKLKIIIISIIALIILSIIIYLLISYYNYNNTECYKKKSYYEYITNFSDTNVCYQEKAPELPKPIPKPATSVISILEDKKEVFHIANQDYTYDQAKCKCESYGGRLATKAEITNAYNNGANWCTYGWSDKQSAFYPVQQCYWDSIDLDNQRLPDNQKKYCGLPGLNGGFFANPEIKFGANCYGIKPKGSLNNIEAKKPYCPPMNFCKLESNFQASNKLDTDEIVGFNNEQWNMNL
jgi:hypothetical protein